MREPESLYKAMARLERGGWRVDGGEPRPWRVTAGVDWTVATDGHVMVAVSGERLTDAIGSAKDSVVKAATKFLSMAAEDPIAVPSLVLKDFAGVGDEIAPCAECKGEREVRCDECDGDGETACTCDCGDEHEADCDECRGKGVVKCPVCRGDDMQRLPVALCGVVVNRSLLARGLAVVMPEDDEALLVHKSGEVLIVRPSASNEWRIVLMGMRDTTARAAFDDPSSWPQRRSGLPQAVPAVVTQG